MAKLDWKKLEQAFRREHVKTGIKLQDWCRQNNISYDTARRYEPPRFSWRVFYL